MTPGSFLGLLLTSNTSKRTFVTFNLAFLGILYLGCFHFVVVYSDGGISRGSSLVNNSCLCLGSWAQDTIFAGEVLGDLMAKGPTALGGCPGCRMKLIKAKAAALQRQQVGVVFSELFLSGQHRSCSPSSPSDFVRS